MTTDLPIRTNSAAACADCGRALLPAEDNSLYIGEDPSMVYSLTLDFTQYLCRDCAAKAGFAPDAGKDGQPPWLKQTIDCQICGQAFPRPWLYQPNCVECQSKMAAKRNARESTHQGIHQQEQSVCPLTSPANFGPCSIVHRLFAAEYHQELTAAAKA